MKLCISTEMWPIEIEIKFHVDTYTKVNQTALKQSLPLFIFNNSSIKSKPEVEEKVGYENLENTHPLFFLLFHCRSERISWKCSVKNKNNTQNLWTIMKNVKGDHVKAKEKNNTNLWKTKNMWRPNSRSHVHFVSLRIMFNFYFNFLYSDNPAPFLNFSGYIHSTKKKKKLQELCFLSLKKIGFSLLFL